MKELTQILTEINILSHKGNLNKNIASVHSDSRKVQENSLFVAIKGLTVDGHKFIKGAVEKGATAIVCESIPEKINKHVTYIKVKDSAKELGRIAARFYGNPSKKIKLVGITGTNGKTTTATLLHQLFIQNGHKAGLISTIANYINEKRVSTKFTTPDALKTNELLKEMVDQGCEYAFMEVSSHALKQKRISGLRFEMALFTNITHEHLDYHKTFNDYIQSKKLLFDNYLDKNSTALINTDDRNARIMTQNTRAQTNTFALKSQADFKGKIIEKHMDGTLLSINNNEVWTQFIGQFNAYNILGVYAAARLLGYEKEKLLVDISSLKPVDGRFETIYSKDNKTAIVDYAHSPDALENVLETINELQKENQEVITLIGAGGDRDKTKRPQMAKIAVNYSNKVILTSDNPRTEKPEMILKDMKKGVPKDSKEKVVVIPDRKEAIRTACMIAKPNDIILVAGKGHETYQEINGIRHHFDDREVIKETFDN